MLTHPSAMDLGRLLFQTHVAGVRRVLDIGSRDLNGSLRDVCPPDIAYVGIDIERGKGGDMVLDDPYRYPFADGVFDMIVSTSCFEHDPMFWLTFLEILRVTWNDGIIYSNATAMRHRMDIITPTLWTTGNSILMLAVLWRCRDGGRDRRCVCWNRSP